MIALFVTNETSIRKKTKSTFTQKPKRVHKNALTEKRKYEVDRERKRAPGTVRGEREKYKVKMKQNRCKKREISTPLLFDNI